MADLPDTPSKPAGKAPLAPAPRDCGEVVYRLYRLVGAVDFDGRVERRPVGAPPHGRPAAVIRKELEAKAARSVALHNATSVGLCGDRCTKITSRKYVVTGHTLIWSAWTERFSGTDADGKPVSLEAQYLATGKVTIEVSIITDYCAPILGDALPDAFRHAADESWKIDPGVKWTIPDRDAGIPEVKHANPENESDDTPKVPLPKPGF